MNLTPAQEAYEAATYSPALRAALRDLRKLLAADWEFPDACWKVASKAGFLVDELRRAYDDVSAI